MKVKWKELAKRMVCTAVLVSMLSGTIAQDLSYVSASDASQEETVDDSQPTVETTTDDSQVSGEDSQNDATEVESQTDDTEEAIEAVDETQEETTLADGNAVDAALPADGDGWTWVKPTEPGVFTLTWNENWGWTGGDPGNAFRPNMATLQFQLQVTNAAGESTIITGQSDTSTKPNYIDFSRASTSMNSWPIYVQNLEDGYTLTGVAVKAIDGYSLSANSAASTITASVDGVNYTVAKDTVVGGSSNISYRMEVRRNSAQYGSALYTADRNYAMTWKVPRGYQVTISTNNAINNGNYVLYHDNGDGTTAIDKVTTEKDQLLKLDAVTSDVTYNLVAIKTEKDSFTKIWDDSGNDHISTSELNFTPYFYIEGYTSGGTAWTPGDGFQTFYELTSETSAILFGADYSGAVKSVKGNTVTHQLPKYTYDGKSVIWAYKEDPVEKYQANYIAGDNGTMNAIRNEYAGDEFTVNVAWKNAAAPDAEKPGQIVLGLYSSSSEELVKSITLIRNTDGTYSVDPASDVQGTLENHEDGSLSYTFTSLKGSDGYYVIETLNDSENYVALDNGLCEESGDTAWNVISGKVDFSFTAKWIATDLPKPETTTFYLYRYENKDGADLSQGEQVPTGTGEYIKVTVERSELESSDEISLPKTMTDLDKYSEEGYEYVYYVIEKIGKLSNSNANVPVNFVVNYESTDEVVYDGQTVVNIPDYNKEVIVTVDWKAAAAQEVYGEYYSVIGLMKKNADGTYTPMSDEYDQEVSFVSGSSMTARLKAPVIDSETNTEAFYVPYQKEIYKKSGEDKTVL